jgi:hypothetical protein
MDLKEIPTADLAAEVARRQAEALAAAEKKDAEERDFWLANIDFILKLMPDHSRTSCSDDNVANQYRCPRCALLKAKDYGHWEKGMTLTVTLDGYYRG